MSPARLRELLFPGAAERDEGFLQEILRLSHISLRVTGGAELVVPPVMLLALFVSDPAIHPLLIGQALAIVVVGAITTLVARSDWSYERARRLALISIWLVSVVIIIASLLIAVRVPGTGHYIPGRFTALMMVVITVIPLRPMQTFGLATAVAGCYLAASLAARAWLNLPASELDAYDHIITLVVTLMATGLTAVAYEQRHANYRSYLMVLQASQELRQVQSHMLMSESSASLGRLAAAISHELNNPLGVLKSAVSTLAALAARLETAKPEDQPRLRALQKELLGSVEDSAGRLQSIVRRMQRFTNLDRAEVQSANLNDILGDVAALIEPQIQGEVKLSLRLDSLAPINCRPQQLSAVFSTLISNAVEACNGSGVVDISTRPNGTSAEVEIRDTGRGMAPTDAARVFDPGFRVNAGRVGTGNWSLFNSRQIIREHGGEIKVSSIEGEGTTVSVTLPYEGIRAT
ncbi:MAG: sensor histidine kinase [Bryobacteraceae bacterium]